ncbi:MAG: glycoside hydrolase [Candidatus Dormibacteraeota bacterium]|nr:glycoside hydrolase [Candidatus Dormibacteraeota bacterium]
MKGNRIRRRRIGLLGALTAVSGFVMWGGGSAYAIQGGFLGDEEGDILSGPVDMRDVSPNTTLTECPQAGLTGNGAQPLNSHRQDNAERKSGGSDRRLNQDFSCMPQDETAVDQNPKFQANYVAGANDYRLGWGTSGFYSTTDKGAHWYDGITPFPSIPSGQNLDGGGDPSIVFDRGGIAYYAQINFNRTDDTSGVWVNRSTNGGFTWTRPCVAFEPTPNSSESQAVCGGPGDARQPGDGTVAFQQDNDALLNRSQPIYDKEWITAGPRPTGISPQCFTPLTHTPRACSAAVIGSDRLYVTYSLFAKRGSSAGNAQIMFSYSDDQARSWSPSKPIYGTGSFCFAANSTCKDSQGSQPTVNPTTGQLWVGFINGDTADEDQYLVVSSKDGGNTFSLPSRVDTLYDVNFPRGVNGRTDCVARGQGSTRAVPTNSCFRYDPIFNSIVADKRGGEFASSVYVTLYDNRNGTIRNSNADIFFYKSTDGGTTWIGPTRVNNDRSTAPANRDCGRNAEDVTGDPSKCPAAGTGNDQFFPFVTISTDGVLNVTFHDRRLDTSSPIGSGAWPASKTAVGNYLVWYWGAQCKITHAVAVSQPTTTGPVPAGASQCVAPEAVVNPTVATGFNPGSGPVPGQNQNVATLPFRNFQISDVGSNFDYSFRAGIFAGDYSGNVSGPTVAAGSSTGNGDNSENGDRGNRDAIAVWTDARNGRGSGAPTSFQPGRNPICEQSDVFFKFFNNQNAGDGSRGRESDSANGFLVAPCGGDMQDKGGSQGGDNSQNH